MPRHFDALVHATPLGMYPHVNECFFNGHIPADVVFDMVYNPLETVLMQRAREQGKTVMPGLEMFIEQAVRQFEIWTGEIGAPRRSCESGRRRRWSISMKTSRRAATWRQCVSASAVALAQTAAALPAASRPSELQAARDRLKANGDALAKQQRPHVHRAGLPLQGLRRLWQPSPATFSSPPSPS